MRAKSFFDGFCENDIEFFAGVPDSLLKPFVDHLTDHYGVSDKHIITANEGNAVALAAGYHLATGKVPCVYLQNSGLGNVVNPVVSLVSERVYGIPIVFVIGWRGEPGVQDEPQHLFQGEITLKVLDILGVNYMVVDKETGIEELRQRIVSFRGELDKGKSVAFVVKKGAFIYNKATSYQNQHSARREDIIRSIVKFSGGDLIIATTGKTARELCEVRAKERQAHNKDFLTVGSMGHCSSIALGLALNQANRRIWCLDGDGAALMHLGALSTIGALSPNNFVHILINNEAHESVGGQPTAAKKIDFCGIAGAVGYSPVHMASTIEELEEILIKIKDLPGPIFVEVKTAIGSRGDLGRPTTTPVQNKEAFMKNIRGVNK